MKRFSKLTAVLLALVLIIATASAVSAADATATPGATATVSFYFDNIAGIDGNFTFGNAAIMAGAASYSNTQTMMGSVQNDIAFFYGSALTSITINVSVPISASAQPGDTCTVNFTYETSDLDGNMSAWNTVSKTIEVAAATVEPTTPTTPTTPPAPTEPAVKIDYTELNKQIDAATALIESEYTADSWAALADALAAAQAAKTSKDQDTVDAAAKALADAIADLVKLDYTALQNAIESVETFLSGDALEGKLSSLMSALSDAKALLGTARDQESIDAAAKALSEALADLEEYLQGMIPTEPVETEPTEPTAPAEPEGDYCNIKIHYVWPVLFFISLAVNIAFAVLTILYFRKKKENEAADAENNGDAK